MQLVIDIPEITYHQIQALVRDNYFEYDICGNSMRRIANGTPLPKGHGRLIDVDKFLEKVKKDRGHEVYLHSWTADMVLERLDSWYAPTIIEADRSEEDG